MIMLMINFSMNGMPIVSLFWVEFLEQIAIITKDIQIGAILLV